MERVRIEPAALFLLALGLLILPVKWVLSWALAAAVHECCHYGAIRLCGGGVPGLTLGGSGAQLEAVGLTPGKELLCTLAGPLGGLSLLLLARWLPAVAVCALFQSLWNLLPLFPMDGGRALRCVLLLTLPERTALALSRATTWAVLAGIGLLALYGTLFLGLGPMPLIFGGCLAGKIACKPGRSIVQ